MAMFVCWVDFLDYDVCILGGCLVGYDCFCVVFWLCYVARCVGRAGVAPVCHKAHWPMNTHRCVDRAWCCQSSWFR